MDVKQFEAININGISNESRKEEEISIRKGAWSFEEDTLLINYIAIHGEGRWNHLARSAGLKRTGKSCRMRWKNYLQPNIRRGDFTPEEQLRIIELHCYYGNRWSKIAQWLPGRTDNEIKNYWRTRVRQKAKLLKYDINSIQFREFIRTMWLPMLSEQIQASKSHSGTGPVIEKKDYMAELCGPHLSEPVEAHSVSEMDDLWKSDCGGYDDVLLSPFSGYGFYGIDSPQWFNYEELSDDYFGLCP